MQAALESDELQWRLSVEGYAFEDADVAEDADVLDATLVVVTGRLGGVRADFGVDAAASDVRRLLDGLRDSLASGSGEVVVGAESDDFSLRIMAPGRDDLEPEGWLVSGHVGWDASAVCRFSERRVTDAQLRAFTQALTRVCRAFPPR